eukprot:349615-Chlamydomonas_euryale.AAC.5
MPEDDAIGFDSCVVMVSFSAQRMEGGQRLVQIHRSGRCKRLSTFRRPYLPLVLQAGNCHSRLTPHPCSQHQCTQVACVRAASARRLATTPGSWHTRRHSFWSDSRHLNHGLRCMVVQVTCKTSADGHEVQGSSSCLGEIIRTVLFAELGRCRAISKLVFLPDCFAGQVFHALGRSNMHPSA